MFIIVCDVCDFLLCRASQFVNDPSTAAQLIQLLLPFLLNQSEKYKVCKILSLLEKVAHSVDVTMTCRSMKRTFSWPWLISRV